MAAAVRPGSNPSLASDLPLRPADVPLRLELAGQERGLRLEFPEVLALLPAFGNRLIIEAPAGFGKTTLQWLTRTSLHADTRARFPDAPAVLERLDAPFRSAERRHEAARTEHEEDPLRACLRQLREALPADAVPWHEHLPALLRLRALRNDDLWPITEWPKRIAPQAGIETRDWWTAAVREGRAILLLDGVDEVPQDRRGRLRQAIEALIAAHPKAMLAVTSRPGAVRDVRRNALFADARLSIEPMGPPEIETFVGHWHGPLRQIPPGRAPSEEEEHRLLRRILDRPGLRNLAQLPLLCAAICWLARIRRGELPDRMPALFEKPVDQLVHRLDAERLARDGLARLVPVLEGLDSTDRISLLARLAWFAVRERRAMLDRGPAERQITEGLRDLGKAEGRDVPRLLDALQERSGILWPAGEDAVEFVHNALRGFLAARRFADEEATEDPVRAALDLDDQDLPVLAAARGTRGYRKTLIRALLDRAGCSLSDPATARRLRIAALRCTETGEIAPDLRETLRVLDPHEPELLALPWRLRPSFSLREDSGRRIQDFLRSTRRMSI